MDVDGEDQGSSEEKKVTSVGLKQNILNANKKDTGDDEDDEVNIDDADEGNKGESNESEPTKLAGAITNDETADMTVEPEVLTKQRDFPLLDMLSSFLYEDEEPLPILCGYFSKIME